VGYSREEAIEHVVNSVRWNLAQDENECTKDELFKFWVEHVKYHHYPLTNEDILHTADKADVIYEGVI